ncbi:MAG: cobyrinate a,c-diamide synthase, partial [Deltaproteobacteria bacterium]
VGSDSHGQLLNEAISVSLPDIKVFGCIPRDDSLHLPSRHLGLVTAEDNPLSPEFLDKLADLAERHLDLDGLIGLEIFSRPPLTAAIGCGNEDKTREPVRIAVARDSSFCFVYEDNLRLLREAGGKIVYFSPLEDEGLPPGCGGIYLPGGYPELYAERLSNNESMKAAIRKAVEMDMPVYAECGGLIYLTLGIYGVDGRASDFVGIFPLQTKMLPKRKVLGYRQVDLLADSIIGPSGSSARGHEFHYSEISEIPAGINRSYRLTRQGKELGEEGYTYRNCLASYIHLHFGSNKAMAASFVAVCRNFKGSSVFQPNGH